MYTHTHTHMCNFQGTGSRLTLSSVNTALRMHLVSLHAATVSLGRVASRSSNLYDSFQVGTASSPLFTQKKTERCFVICFQGTGRGGEREHPDPRIRPSAPRSPASTPPLLEVPSPPPEVSRDSPKCPASLKGTQPTGGCPALADGPLRKWTGRHRRVKIRETSGQQVGRGATPPGSSPPTHPAQGTREKRQCLHLTLLTLGNRQHLL